VTYGRRIERVRQMVAQRALARRVVRSLPVIAIACAHVAMAGCAGSGAKGAPGDSPDPFEAAGSGVAFALESTQIPVGSSGIRGVITNRTRETLSFGTEYELERKSARGWDTVPGKHVSSLMLVRLGPGGAEELRFTFPRSLEMGTYRVSKKIISPPEDRETRVQATFRVG
jgi:hypothetical protein